MIKGAKKPVRRNVVSKIANALNQTGRPSQWTLESRETLHERFYRIDSVRFTHELHDGGSTGVIERELFVRGNVVGVLAYDPKLDSVALVEQFRIGAMYQQPDPWTMEIIAGMIDTDESPEEVGVREAYEEAGIKLDELQLVSHYLASPGASNEEVFLYYSETDLRTIGGCHGLPEENEDIRVVVMPAEQVFELLEQGVIRNALSIIALQWLKLKRAGLA